MKVVFLGEVEGSGRVGEVKEVKNGFARNYLLPRGLAAPATKDVMERARKLARADATRQEKLDAAAHKLAARLDGRTVTLRARVGEQGRLFGSITAGHIAQALSALAGEEIEHRQVLLGQAIRHLGSEEVRVRLTRNVFATVTAVVEAEGEPGVDAVQAAIAAMDAAEAAAAANSDQ